MEKIKPFKLEPVLMKKIWGGRRLESVLGKKLPKGKFGESWEISTHRNGINRIATGAYRGKLLKDVIKENPSAFLGKSLYEKGVRDLPILVKFIDATDKLSVQVHPDDKYALAHENDMGKTESWYILYAEPGAQLIYGLKEGTTKEMLKNSIQNDYLEDFLRYVDISSGDVLFVPAGTVHAILGGVVLLEVQESSDSTYRLYDWKRVGFDGKPRPLHIDKALDVINYSFNGSVYKPSRERKPYGYFSTLVSCRYFSINRYEFSNSLNLNIGKNERFKGFILTEGNCEFRCRGVELELKKGEALYIPPSCTEWEFIPFEHSEIIEIFVD